MLCRSCTSAGSHIISIYWEICLVNDLNTAANTPNDTNGVMVLVLSIVTCSIYMYYWMYKAGTKVQTAQQQRNLPSDSNSGVIYLVLTIFGLGIVAYCLIQNELNKMATTNA